MTKQFFTVVGLAAAVLVQGRALPDCQADSPLVFNSTTPVNDLKGSFAAQVLFAQSQILPSGPREGDNQPYLTSFRKSLIMVRPLKVDRSKPMSVEAYDGQGRTLGRLKLDPPKLLPKTAYHVDGVPNGDVDFTPMKGTVGTIRRSEDLKQLSDKEATFIRQELKRHAAVDIDTADGRWVKEMYLPQDKGLNGKLVRVRSQAGYQSTVYYSGRQAALTKGTSLQFKCVNGQWLQAADLENNRLTYAEDTWSTVLPAEWIEPGLKLRISQGDQIGELSGMKVGAPTQLLIHTIDIGMLTTPRDEFAFAEDSEAHREYFQTIPVSRLIVAQYAPLELSEVIMPDGSRLTDSDPSEGGWHTGDMRQRIGKELISHGIDNANYGINSLAGEGEAGHPYVAAQLAAHNNRGKYSNGIQVHGGSGGGGIVTLDNSLGNELSHEIGHNYGLGHYVDGFRGSVHRGADKVNSTWGGTPIRIALFRISPRREVNATRASTANAKHRSTVVRMVSMRWQEVNRCPA